MKLTVKYNSLINLPIYFVYYLFPFISIMGQQLLGKRISYEFFWMFLLCFFPFVSSKRSIRKKCFISIGILLLLLSLKYLTPLCFMLMEISIRPFMIEMKWVLYLLLALFWTNFVGMPEKQLLYKGGRFFCYVYIIYSLFVYKINGGIVRVGIIDEANYDGLLMLIPFCFIFEGGYRKRDVLVFVIATIMTGSRTGCMAMLVVFACYIFRGHMLLLLSSVPILFGAFVLLLVVRGGTDLESVDRYIFFYQAYEYFKESDLWTFLLGALPGTSLKMSVIPEFIWYIENFNNINGITGIYPFYFHSAYIRLSMILGIPFVLICIWWLVYRFVKSNYYPLKMLIIIILLQSISLATHSLTNVTPILFFTWFLMTKISREQYKIN